MNSDPIKNYFKAITSFKAGDRPGAERFLADSLGLKELTPILKTGLSKVLDSENPNPAIAHLVAHRLIDGGE